MERGAHGDAVVPAGGGIGDLDALNKPERSVMRGG